MIGRPQSPALGPRLAGAVFTVVICGRCQPLPGPGLNRDTAQPGCAPEDRTEHERWRGWALWASSSPSSLPSTSKCFLGAGREVTDGHLREMPEEHLSTGGHGPPESCRTLQEIKTLVLQVGEYVCPGLFLRVKCLLLCQRVRQLRK